MVLVLLAAAWSASELVAVAAQVAVSFPAAVAAERVALASLHLFSDRVCCLVLTATLNEASAFLEQEVATFPEQMRPSVFASVRLDLFVLSSQLGLACCGERVRPSVAL